MQWQQYFQSDLAPEFALLDALAAASGNRSAAASDVAPSLAKNRGPLKAQRPAQAVAV
jgi:hypothetical protein